MKEEALGVAFEILANSVANFWDNLIARLFGSVIENELGQAPKGED